MRSSLRTVPLRDPEAPASLDERRGLGHVEAVAPLDHPAMRAAISDEFTAGLTTVVDEASVRAGIQRYTEAGVTLSAIGAIARTDFEATLRASAPEPMSDAHVSEPRSSSSTPT